MENLVALMLFAFVSSVTPGPNNLMLLSSGMNFGIRRTLPHALGIIGGCFVMWAATGLGLGALMLAWPPAESLLRILGSAYLLYLAWRISGAGAVKEGAAREAKPLSALGAALFQWVNPKAWMMALTTFAAYALGTDLAGIMLTTAVTSVVMLPAISLWVMGGHSLRHWLQSPRRARLFNLSMAALLLLTLVPVFLRP